MANRGERRRRRIEESEQRIQQYTLAILHGYDMFGNELSSFYQTVYAQLIADHGKTLERLRRHEAKIKVRKK